MQTIVNFPTLGRGWRALHRIAQSFSAQPSELDGTSSIPVSFHRRRIDFSLIRVAVGLNTHKTEH